jgi:hypothetical protein
MGGLGLRWVTDRVAGMGKHGRLVMLLLMLVLTAPRVAAVTKAEVLRVRAPRPPHSSHRHCSGVTAPLLRSPRTLRAAFVGHHPCPARVTS